MSYDPPARHVTGARGSGSTERMRFYWGHGVRGGSIPPAPTNNNNDLIIGGFYYDY